VDFYWLFLGVLTTWRVTHLLAAEDGPFRVIVRLRARLGNGFLGDLMDCFQCLSLWIAAPLAWLLGSGAKQRLLLWLSCSAGAILLESLSERKAEAPQPYYELPQKGESDVVLRQGKSR
jgi:hypothetical protein